MDPHALSVLPAWPTLFFHRTWKEQAAEAPGIVEHLYRLREGASGRIASGIATGAKSAYGLYESTFDLFESDHPGLIKLAGFIRESLRATVSRINGSELEPAKIDVQILDSWFHITNQGGLHDAHFHSGCSWCGIYYLQSGDPPGRDREHAGNGVNRFYSPIPTGGSHADYGNKYLSANRIDITPKDGLLFLFPSYLLHSALPYRGTIDRIVIAFNSKAILK